MNELSAPEGEKTFRSLPSAHFPLNFPHGFLHGFPTVFPGHKMVNPRVLRRYVMYPSLVNYSVLGLRPRAL